MSIKIEIKNNVIKGNTKIGNNSKITEGFNSESTISINNSDIKGDISILENLEISTVFNQVKVCMRQMEKNSIEYQDLKLLLEEDKTNRVEILNHIKNHLANFAQGVLASVIANYIS